MTHLQKSLVCAAALLVAAACADGGTSSSVPTTVTVTPGRVSMDAVGATEVVRAGVADQNGQPMPGASVSWQSSSDAVTVTGLGGDSARVTARASGSATVTATAGSASASMTAEVIQVVANTQFTGSGQTGPAGTTLPQPLRVVLLDRLNAPIPGRVVTFAAEGGGSVAPTTVTTGADGAASTTWTLGTTVGEPQEAFAGFGTMLRSVQFTATVVPGPASAGAAVAGNNQVAQPGSAVPVAPRVRVRDAFDNPVSGVAVTFAVTAGGGSVTGATQVTGADGTAAVGGWTVGPTGTNTLSATFPGTGLAPVVFTARAAITGAVVFTAGNNQGAMAGTVLPTAPTVVVRDGNGSPLPGLQVSFQAGNGGSVTNATATTDASGVASAGSWRLGPTGGPNTLTVTVPAVSSPTAQVRAIGCSGGGGSGYVVTLCFTSEMTSAQRAVFENSVARWSNIITGDLPDITTSIPAASCGAGSPSLSMNFDDLVIFASVEPIDGPGAVLGSAGWCVRRSGGLPLVGLMRFDVADVTRLEEQGQFSAVILHEMGHVIGIGTMWNALGLLQNPSSAGAPTDAYFNGPNAIEGFNAIGGSTYTGGQKVPVENTGGPGTMNGHWRESVLANELMTGFLNTGTSNPLSLLTVRSLTDLGYVVNTAAADPFSVTLSLRDGDEPVRTLKLHNDIYTGPRYTVDRQGRITRLRD